MVAPDDEVVRAVVAADDGMEQPFLGSSHAHGKRQEARPRSRLPPRPMAGSITHAELELPYLNVRLQMSWHDIVVIGYDAARNAYVVDNDRAEVQEVPYAALARARASGAFPVPTRVLLLVVKLLLPAVMRRTPQGWAPVRATPPWKCWWRCAT